MEASVSSGCLSCSFLPLALFIIMLYLYSLTECVLTSGK